MICPLRTAIVLAASAIVLATPVAAVAQEAQVPDTEEAEIVILGMAGEPFRLTSDRLRDAIRTYEEKREALAPQATLEWTIRNYDPTSDLALTLVDRKSKQRTKVAITPDGRFVLPHDRMLERKFDLVANRSREPVGIMPTVFSPGGTLERHRVGDARLACHVTLAFIDNDMSAFERMVLRTVGGCDSSRVSAMRGTDRPIATVDVSGWDGEIRVADDRRSYRMPVHDRSLDNESIITLRYAQEGSSAD
ncbi:hypothetical protein WJT74_04990 [Sphingomicrobium sp. XHP0239]|uniref:hypothetical protein n=1 Tax=Sphingomicrobium maritimum TaxID=3133972 RepID=UPI0031CCD228